MNELGNETIKSRRQKTILKLIGQHSIKTQTMLREWLRREGIHVTQATISRDIRELSLIKGVNGEGYIQNRTVPTHQISHRLFVMFSMAVRSVEQSGNVIVITCEPGMAAPVCSIIDHLGWNEIIGTIAGNDTIFVITREGTSHQLAEQFKNINS